jgi:hypothetical protein
MPHLDPGGFADVAQRFALWFWTHWQAIYAVLPPDLFGWVKFFASLRFQL